MAQFHGSVTVVTIGGSDISAFTNTSEMSDESDMHDVTCFGAVRKAYLQGLGDGTFTIGGVHESGATGPRKVLKALKASRASATFVYRPEGTGTGKAQSSVSVFVKNYTDTSAVADAVRWKATLQMSGALTETDQT